MIEEWKDIPGFEGLYKISSFGRVKSMEKIRVVGHGTQVMVYPEIILKQTNNGNYQLVMLSSFGKRKMRKIHRLVAIAFVENPMMFIYNEVNHKDGDKLNNHYSNLEWCSRSQNVKHAYDTGLYKDRKKRIK